MSGTSRNTIIQPSLDKRLEAYLWCLKLPDNGSRNWSQIANALIETFCSADGHPTMPSYMEAMAAGHDFFHRTDKGLVTSYQLWSNLEILLQVMLDCVAEISNMNPHLVLGEDQIRRSQAYSSLLVVHTYGSRYANVERLASRIFAKAELSIIGQEDSWYGNKIHNATDLAAGQLPRLVSLHELFSQVWRARFPNEEG